MKPLCMFSVDVEDWFQVENLKEAIPRDSWDHQELRVEENVHRILQVLSDHQAKGTFFVLGWIAKRCPALIKQIAAEGHEIASHGYNHHLLNEMSPQTFEADIRHSKTLLEDLVGQPVIGFRAPSFSIADWAVPLLKQADFLYDSSYFHNPYHSRYGQLTIPDNLGGPIISLRERFYEVMLPSLKCMDRPIPWAGGGYFRLYPIRLYCAGVKWIIKKQGDFLFYMHPWEIDPEQPRVTVSNRLYTFRHYYGLARTYEKLTKLLETFRFVPIQDLIKERFQEENYAKEY